MNSHISYFSHADIAEMGVPWGYAESIAYPGEWDLIQGDSAIKADAIERIADMFDLGLRNREIKPSKKGQFDGRRDSAHVAMDAAEVFYTNTLEVLLSSIVRQPKTSTVMTGPDAMLPVKSTLRPGQLAGVYDIESTTGQAAWVEPDGARKLNTVGEFAERMKYTAQFIGIAYNIGLVEMWRAAEMGKPLEAMRRMTAEAALQRFAERVLLYGDAGHEVLGVLANSHAYFQTLGSNFTSEIATPDDAQVMLQIMEVFFKTIGETYSADAPITGVIAPAADRRAFERMRWPDSDLPAWPDFLKMHPWLNDVRWVEHIHASGPNGGNQWVLWSDDPIELWSELNPTPMLFGPWQDSNTGLRKSWAMIQQIGGVILRRRERMVRFEFPA
jgi:hypothetical protein